MSKVGEILHYLIASDHLKKSAQKKEQIKQESASVLEREAKLIFHELKEHYLYPAVVLSRVTGIDAVRRAVRKHNQGPYEGLDTQPYQGPQDIRKPQK